MVNYQNGKIYRIVCNISGKQYIGSTTQSLAARKAKHKYELKNKQLYSSKEIIENNNYDIILIENYPCNNKEELLQRERYYIENMECINKWRPIITEEERKQKKKELWNIFNEKNKQRIKTERSVKITCECGCIISKGHLTRHVLTKKHLNNI